MSKSKRTVFTHTNLPKFEREKLDHETYLVEAGQAPPLSEIVDRARKGLTIDGISELYQANPETGEPDWDEVPVVARIGLDITEVDEEIRRLTHKQQKLLQQHEAKKAEVLRTQTLTSIPEAPAEPAPGE